MKAWLLDDFSGLDHLRLGEAPEPNLREGEVILQMHFAALNPADRYLAQGQYPAKPPLPHILGRDGLGIVTQIGPGVSGIRAGDKRAILRGGVGVERAGTFAERVAVLAQNLVEIPAGWSDTEAAGATLVYLTAYQALTMWGPLGSASASSSSSQSAVLVTGATGGVGTATIQLAIAMGHTVYALSRSRDKAARLRELGVAAVFDPNDPLWRKALKVALAPRRVDLAIDSIGGELLPQVIETLGDSGKVSIVGRLAGPVPNFNTSSLFFRRLRLGGVAVGAYTNAESRAAWQDILVLLSRTGARPLVDQVFPFEELPEAFERLAEGPIGKVLLQVSAQ
jgi:NADPH2:quinone reductase